MSEDRPLGTVFMAIIFIAAGTGFLILGALALLGLLNPILGLLSADPTIGTLIAPIIAMLLPFITVIAIAVIILGILNLIGAVGILSKQGWGWLLAMITSIAWIIVIIGLIFLWYLNQDDTKSAFGKY